MAKGKISISPMLECPKSLTQIVTSFHIIGAALFSMPSSFKMRKIEEKGKNFILTFGF
jgi:hypothetical protein